jgi:hypothetical protein
MRLTGVSDCEAGAGVSGGFSPAGLDYAAVTFEASNPPERIPIRVIQIDSSASDSYFSGFL